MQLWQLGSRCIQRIVPRFSSAVCLASYVCLACLGCTQPQQAVGPPGPPKVVVTQAITQTITDYDEYIGRTEPSETVEVRSRVSGFLRTIDFVEGQYVTEGDLLATIEPDEYEAIYVQSQSRIAVWDSKLALARSSLKRAEDLIKTGAISQEEYEVDLAAVKEAEAQVVASKADADRTALDVKYTKIHAPLSGKIDRAFVTPGNMLTGGLGAGTTLTRIVNNRPIYVYMDVDEASILRYLRKARMDESSATATQNAARSLKELDIDCFVQLNDESDFPHAGKLDFIENRIAQGTSTIRLRGVLQNEDNLLLGGMFVRVRIPISDPYEAVLIPEVAIGTDQSYKYAVVIDSENKAHRRTLELGRKLGELRIIKSGIDSGEQVITQGMQRVRPGMTVAPQLTPPRDGQAVASSQGPGATQESTAQSEAISPPSKQGAAQ